MPPTNQTESVFANWLINKGLVKSETGANAIMIVFVIVCFAISTYLIV